MLRQAITSELEHAKWLRSEARADLCAFTRRLAESCVGTCTARAAAAEASGADAPGLVAAALALRDVGSAVSAPAKGDARRGRFGDSAFRPWFDWVAETGARAVVSALLAESDVAVGQEQADEVAAYIAASFGDRQRLDYGTAHETSFVVALLCLVRLGVISEALVDSGAVVKIVFAEYLRVCRLVQTTYSLEPAGSRGAWSLDDYQILPFACGAAMHLDTLQDEARSDFVSTDGTLECVEGSMFSESLVFTASAKTGAPFAETCPILHALNGRPWRFIVNSVLGTYEREIIGKYVVARHIYFSSLFPATWQVKASAARRRASDDAARRRPGDAHGSSGATAAETPSPTTKL
ncbi:Phosphotyrosyl phosphatase activator [Pelagophyceae sp. CCMP2097]|nr:Phosphotyrosyl phosphatase activator [Pelagophyceae sp. CCMP2097]